MGIRSSTAVGVACVVGAVVATVGSPAMGTGTPGQAPPGTPSDPPVFEVEGCSDTATSITFTKTRGELSRTVTVTHKRCEDGYVLVTRYKSPWTR